MTYKDAFALLASLALLLPLGAEAARAADEAPPAKKYEVDPLDWPYWRGPEQNSISRETGLPEKWNPKGGEGSNLLWKRDDLGTRSTPIVMHGKLYVLARAEPGTLREGEKVVCLNAETGETIWENRFNVYLSDVPDTRVGWSCVVGDPETGRVYAQGVSGPFLCIDGETGETLWQHSMHEEYGLVTTYGGRTNMPIIFEDLVLISGVTVSWDELARPAHRFLAFDKMTGELVWFNGTRISPYDTTYSAPFVTTFDGEAAMVFGSGDGQIWALQPRTGKHIWNYPISRRGLNTSPIVVDNIVYTGHSEENLEGTAMGAVVAIDGRQKGDLTGKHKWFNYEVPVGKSSPLMIDGRLYVVTDSANLLIFDPETGEQIARQSLGTVMRSTPLYADGKLYVCTNDGRFYTLEPTEKGVKILFRTRFPVGEQSDGSPIASHGRIYVPTSAALYCIGFKDAEPQATPIPEPPKEAPISEDPTPAQLQIVPYEVLLRPGQSQKFTVRQFNSRGQLLGTVEAALTVDGAGQITSDGTFTAASDAAHQAAYIHAKAGDLTAKARVRVVPDLPWKWDFNELDDLPITWVGGRVRYIIQDINGERAAMKRDVIPTGPGRITKIGTRSRAWFGPVDLKNYTVQADVMATRKDGKMPDAGLINQRYTLDLQGEAQQMQLRTWDAQLELRMVANAPYAWQPDVWYTIKISTEPTDDGKLLVHGKVWPRDEAEPEAWTVTAVDEAPNWQGSPGLYGNSGDAVYYLDNVTVTPN